MSLRDELRNRYRLNVYESDRYKDEFCKLKNKLLKESESYTCYVVDKNEYPILMENKRVFEMWLEENDLSYNGVGVGNKFIELMIEW